MRTFIRTALLFLVPALPVLLVGTGFGTARADEEEPARVTVTASTNTIERVVAVVNGEVILLSEVRERTAQLGQAEGDGAQGQRLLRQVVDRMVDDQLVLQQSHELKLTVEEAEIDGAVDQVKKSNNLDDTTFAQALTEQGYTLQSFRKDMRRQLLRMKTVNNAVRARLTLTDEDLKAYYEQTTRQSGARREAHVKHVLVAVPPKADEKTVEAKRRVAVKVLEDARGGAEFGKLAKQLSDDDKTKNDGGDLGWLKEGDGLPELMSEVIFSMEKAGEVRGPIRTERGFEVFLLVERRTGDVMPFDEVKDQIRAKLTQQQIEKQTQVWLQELRKKAHLEVRL